MISKLWLNNKRVEREAEFLLFLSKQKIGNQREEKFFLFVVILFLCKVSFIFYQNYFLNSIKILLLKNLDASSSAS